MSRKGSRRRLTATHVPPMGRLNQPEKTTQTAQDYERIACVFQGGGALGAYQVGAYRAIYEHGYRPNYFSGVSIGAINAAIIAGNRPEQQIDKLMAFWESIAPRLWVDAFSQTDNSFLINFRNHIGAMHSVLFGLENFFKPRLTLPFSVLNSTPDKLSYYDTSELRHTLENLIDFNLINEKKVTLCLGAVNVESGEMVFFNNQTTTITVDHVMASGALPPGFPAIKIGEDYYWDGGIYANTPLVTVLDALPEQDTLCFVVDCFRLKGHLPQNMDQVEERQKDIRYASHSRRLTNVYASRQNLQTAIRILGEKLPEETKKDPEIQAILALGRTHRFSVVHIIYDSTPYSHAFKDYNFDHSVISFRMKVGYQNATDVLSNPVWNHQSTKMLDCSIYGVAKEYFDQH